MDGIVFVYQKGHSAGMADRVATTGRKHVDARPLGFDGFRFLSVLAHIGGDHCQYGQDEEDYPEDKG